MIAGGLCWLVCFITYCRLLITETRLKHHVNKTIFTVVIFILTAFMIPLAWNSPFLVRTLVPGGGLDRVYKNYIFHKLDRDELVSACRTIIKNRVNYKSNRPEVKSRSDAVKIYFEVPGVAEQLPEVIRKLEPSYIKIADDSMSLVLYSSGFGSLVLCVYLEGVTGDGDKMLSEGLWMTEQMH